MSYKNKIVYMGTPHYAKEILETLIDAEDMEVSLVLTQPDRPVGRKKILTASAVKVLAEECNIEVLQPNRLSDEGIFEAILDVKPDYIIVAAFGQILPKNILDIAPCINLHASLLPQYRGASPIQQSLLNDDEVTGVSSMMMDEGLDTGDVLKVKKFKIPFTMRLHDLTGQLTEDAKSLTLETIREYDAIKPTKQDQEKVTHCKKIKKSDGEVDFTDAVEVYNKYRAFEGWPGIFASNGVKFDDVELLDNDGEHEPFEILKIDGDAGIIACAKGALRVAKLQPSGKKPMSFKSYCMGRGLKVEDLLF